MKENLKRLLKFNFALLASVFMLTGCSAPTEVVTYDGSKFILSAAPEGGKHVTEARDTVKDAEDVVIIGRIGGSLDPWVNGRAAFSIVDPALLACSDEKEEGEPCSCKTPWDYCCETDKLGNAMALVTFVEPDGTVVKHGARDVFKDLKELETVVIQGKAKRDDAGNLTVLASGMFVQR